MLTLDGHHVQMAYDGLSAVDVALRELPEVILLDIGMPGMDGFDVARRIRAAQPALRPSILALTGWGQPQDRERSAAAGVDGHLVKPVDPSALVRLLATLNVQA